MTKLNAIWIRARVKFLVIGYDAVDLMPPIEEHKQAVRRAHATRSAQGFDTTPDSPVPTSQEYQNSLRSTDNSTQIARAIAKRIIDNARRGSENTFLRLGSAGGNEPYSHPA